LSDIDILVVTEKCKGKEDCKIENLLNEYPFQPIDIWCYQKNV